MSNRVLLSILVLFCATASASAAHKHRRRVMAPIQLLDRSLSSSSDGAHIDAETGTVLAVALPLKVPATFVDSHSARVENDLMLFKPTLIGIAPIGASRSAELVRTAPKKESFRFLAPAVEGGDALEVRRDRDRLILFRGPQSQGGAVAVGLAMFIATTISSAHAPRPLRVMFDGPVHLGPAIFDGGGMGAGIAGRL
jgi:hypothetical protein